MEGAMRRYVFLLGAVAWLAAGCSRPVNVEEERNTLMERDRSWSDSVKDTETFVAFYDPEASMYVPGRPIVTGNQAIREAVSEMMAMPGFSIRWSPVKADVSGNLGYTAGTYVMTMNDPSGNPVTEKGKYVTIWKKQQAGEWKVVEDIFNGDTPPPMPSAEPMEPPQD